MTFFVIVTAWLTTSYGNEECGIPVIMWLQVYFGAMMIGAMFGPVSLCVGRNGRFRRGHCHIIKTVLVNTFNVSWFIYGNYLYFSAANDCGENEDIRFAYIVMILLLIFGWILMSFSLCLGVSIICLLVLLRHH